MSTAVQRSIPQRCQEESSLNIRNKTSLIHDGQKSGKNVQGTKKALQPNTKILREGSKNLKLLVAGQKNRKSDHGGREIRNGLNPGRKQDYLELNLRPKQELKIHSTSTKPTAITARKSDKKLGSIPCNTKRTSQDSLTSGKLHVADLTKQLNTVLNVHSRPSQYDGESAKTSISRVPTTPHILFPADSVILGWKKPDVPVGSGFINVGNTCYLNSTLQALFHVPSFANWLLTDKAHYNVCESRKGVRRSECLVCAMAKTLLISQKQTGVSIKPSTIYSRLKLICKHFCLGQQEDAHEFLKYLLEGIERSYLTSFKHLELDNLSKETTPISQIFGGYFRTEVSCLVCKHISTTFQHFQDIILDIQTATTVEEALDQYFAIEKLGDDGLPVYKCEKCKKRVAATKQFTLERPPKALCLQLKRFGIFGNKNSTHITIKQQLDMKNYVYKPVIQLTYKLVGMINHHGQSSNCGHYTAICNTSSGAYYLFDDSTVTRMPLTSVLSTNPYILMYELEHFELTKPTSRIGNNIPKQLIQNGGIVGTGKVTPKARLVKKQKQVGNNSALFA